MKTNWKQKTDNSEKIKLIEQLMDEYESKAALSGTYSDPFVGEINPHPCSDPFVGNINQHDGSAENYFNGVVDGLNKAWKILNGAEDEL